MQDHGIDAGLNNQHINALQLARPRYTDVPFPPYRFVPGKHPHPVASPQGHSYRPPGHVEPPVVYRAPDDWAESVEYLYGCDLYNHAFWWEAHEAWEGLWRVTPMPSPQRSFLQGLIQVGATHLQLFLKNEHGISRLRQTSMEHLGSVLDEFADDKFMGLDLRSFVEQVNQYYAVIRASGKIEHQPTAYPYVFLT